MNKLEKLYDMIIFDELINIDTLHKNGFSDPEIQQLIDDNIIILSGVNYTFKDVEGLYKYGEKLVANFDYGRGKACFRVCLKFNPYHRNSLLQKFLQTLRAQNMPVALQYFDTILSVGGEENYSDNNLYTYLLSLLECVPTKYTDLVDFDELHDFYKETTNEEEHLENDIKRIICENRLTLAMKVLNDLISQNPTYMIRRSVLKELLSKAIDNDKKIKYTILSLISEERFFELVEYLESIRKRRYLVTNEYYILLLAKVAVNILNTKEIPLITNLRPRTFDDALKANNFEYAIILDRLFLKNKHKSEKDDALLAILKKICKLINQTRLENEMTKPLQEELPKFEKPEESGNDSKNLNDILFVMKDSMMSYDDVIESFSLSVEEALILKLLMAKDCFQLGLVNIGEKYLKEVSENSNVTEEVAKIMQEIAANKQVIINGESRKRENN